MTPIGNYLQKMDENRVKYKHRGILCLHFRLSVLLSPFLELPGTCIANEIPANYSSPYVPSVVCQNADGERLSSARLLLHSLLLLLF